MIEVLDRVPTYPGRVKLIPVAGQENTYDMVRADEPIEVGTPINKALFTSIRNDLIALQNSVSNIINDHAYKTTIGNIVVGTEFVLSEGGIQVPFIKLTSEYGGTARSLVIRKDIYKKDMLTTSVQGNNYENCQTDVWLNDEVDGYLSLLQPHVLEHILAVPVETAAGTYPKALKTIQRKAFLLSRRELGFPQDKVSLYEGLPVAYFDGDTRRTAQYNGVLSDYWTRTPISGSLDYSNCVNTGGHYTDQVAFTYVSGIRPAFTLPSDFEVDLSAPDTGNTMATAEVL